MPPAPVDGFEVAIGTVVGCTGAGGVVGTAVAVGFFVGFGVFVGTAGIGVDVAGTAVAVGVIVGVGDGGPGGGVIGVGMNVGGGGGVLAAAKVCSDTLWNEPEIMIRPAVSGTATRRDKRLFIQDSLRVGFAFGSPVCRENVRHKHYRCAMCAHRQPHTAMVRFRPGLTPAEMSGKANPFWLSASPLSLTQR